MNPEKAAVLPTWVLNKREGRESKSNKPCGNFKKHTSQQTELQQNNTETVVPVFTKEVTHSVAVANLAWKRKSSPLPRKSRKKIKIKPS